MRVHTLDLRDKLKATIIQITLYYQTVQTRIQIISKAPKLEVPEDGGEKTRIAVLFSHTVL